MDATGPSTPALATAALTGPNSRSACSAAALNATQSPTSAASAIASPPADLIESATGSTAPRSMSKQAIFAPASASRCAWRAPMPLPAPVTHATRPCMCSGVPMAANSMPAVMGSRGQPAAIWCADRERAHRATVGVIGAGNALWAYLSAIDRLAARGLARPGPICARSRSAWEPILAKRPDAHLVGDASEVLESDADVVVIITPPESHAELASAAVRAGKHVVVEKPLAMEPSDARRVVEEARATGRHLMVSPFVQLSPAFRALWTALRGDAIGHVHSARGL